MTSNFKIRTSRALLCVLCGLCCLAANSATAQDRPRLLVQSGHPDWVMAVAFSADGQTLASGGSVTDGTIRLWDVATGIQLRVLGGHESSISELAFSDDGRLLASSSGAEIILWDMATGEIRRRLRGQPDINQLAFNADGKQLVSGSGHEAQTIKVWDTATGAQLRSVEGRDLFSIIADSFSPDRKTLLVYDADPAHPDLIKLLDIGTRKERLTLRGHEGEVLCAVWSRDGRMIASGGQDNAVRLWNAATGRESRTLKVTSEVVNSLALSPDGRQLASGQGDGSAGAIKIWELTTGKGLTTIDAEARGVKGVAFESGGESVAALNSDGTVRRWETVSGRPLGQLERPSGTDFGMCGDGKLLFGLRRREESFAVSRLDKVTGKALRHFQGLASGARSLECNPDQKVLAVGGMKTAQLWDIETGKVLHTLEGHSFSVLSLAFSADGKLLASGSGIYGREGQIKLWDVATGRLLREVTLPTSGLVFSLSFSPDGKSIAAGSGIQGKVGAVTLFDAATLAELRTLKGHVDFVSSAVYSRDGRLILSGSWDRSVKVWDASTARNWRRSSRPARRTGSSSRRTVCSTARPRRGEISCGVFRRSCAMSRPWNCSSTSFITRTCSRTSSPGCDPKRQRTSRTKTAASRNSNWRGRTRPQTPQTLLRPSRRATCA